MSQGTTSKMVYVEATPANTWWGVLPVASDHAVVAIDSGQTVVMDTVSHEGILPDQGSDPVVYFSTRGVPRDEILDDTVAVSACKRRRSQDGPHVITGPVEVRGAKPGDWLMVRIDRLERRASYGVISTRSGRGVMTGTTLEGNYGALCVVVTHNGIDYGQMMSAGMRIDDPRLEDSGYPRFPLRPFLGIMGVAPNLVERPSSIPPLDCGGNIDVNDLTEGTVLFLPVQAEGANFFVGDPHFAQGDGEVALTALEAPLRATLTLTRIAGDVVQTVLGECRAPFALAHGDLLVLGLDEDFNIALRRSVFQSVGMLATLTGLPAHVIYLYLSAGANFDISQAVDQTRGVHARIPLRDFPSLGPGDPTAILLNRLETASAT